MRRQDGVVRRAARESLHFQSIHRYAFFQAYCLRLFPARLSASHTQRRHREPERDFIIAAARLLAGAVAACRHATLIDMLPEGHVAQQIHEIGSRCSQEFAHVKNCLIPKTELSSSIPHVISIGLHIEYRDYNRRNTGKFECSCSACLSISVVEIPHPVGRPRGNEQSPGIMTMR